MAGYQGLGRIKDQATQDVCKTLFDLNSQLLRRLDTLEHSALTRGSPFDAASERIINVALPEDPGDVVTVAYLRQILAALGVTGGTGVSPTGALDEGPLAVRVDGASVLINASNQLEAPAAAGGITQLTGDGTAGPGSGSQVFTLANTAVVPGTYGSATQVAQITVDSKGRITAITALTIVPAFRGALVRKSVDQTAADYTTPTAIAWDQEDYDTDAFHDNAVNNSRLTVPSGVTRVILKCNVHIQLITADVFISLSLQKNSSLTIPGATSLTTEAGSTTMTILFDSPVIEVTAGDFFEAFLTIQTDTSVTITATRSNFHLQAIT